MTSITDLVNVRELQHTDINFILDSTISCLSKYTESIFKGWNHKDITNYIENIILFVLSKDALKDYSVFIACHREDSQHIVGYIIANPKHNHVLFQYTKYTYRKLGIQKYLLLPLVIDPTEQISVNYPTKEMLKLQKQGKIVIKDIIIESLLKEIAT